MTLTFGSDLTFFGPALPESFVQHELEGVLGKSLPAAKDAEAAWKVLVKNLHEPLMNAGAVRVRNVVLEPLAKGLGYAEIAAAESVRTREGDEPGGIILRTDTIYLRAWAVEYDGDLDAPTKRGLNHRFSPSRIAERVLLATGERLGLLTNGVELRLILSDPARRASFGSFSLSQWKQYRYYDPAPDSFRLLLALARPDGQRVLPEVLEQARLKQGQITKDLRLQARRAILAFVQGVLDHPANAEKLAGKPHAELAPELWREALVMVYRLLFILRGESGGQETPPFSFASTSLWRNTYSPSRAQPGNLAWVAQKVHEDGMPSGEFLEQGLRSLFRAFERGVSSTELNIAPLGGVLFGAQSTPLMDGLKWGEQGCAELLDNLLRAPRGKGKGRALVRLSYRDLDVEDLGRVYEALLELEPGIAAEPMVRLRRVKLEVVVPEAQGEKYRPIEIPQADADEPGGLSDELGDEEEADSDDTADEAAEESGRAKAKTKIEWIESIPVGRFYLRVGLGRKSSGSYYTPESFVRFLVQETLGPQCDTVSPADDPQPLAILGLNVLDPAMGSGHFLVGACRFLADRLYEACRACAERGLWERVPTEVTPYLPGRRLEGESEAGFSIERARALCKRLVTVHCLYGVDKNPLAVELAKVSLWLESFAEGLPLTFLDHRLLCGDSLLGPVNIVSDGPDSPMTPPYATTPLDVALARVVRDRLRERLGVALQKVAMLDATIGIDEQDIAAKQKNKTELNAALRPFVDVCVAWSGGVMLGQEQVDENGYRRALQMLANNEWPTDASGDTRIDGSSPLSQGFITMLREGREVNVFVFPLEFPEVFFPSSDVGLIAGFNAVLGNPPWDKIRAEARAFLAASDSAYLDSKVGSDREIENRLLLGAHEVKVAWLRSKSAVEALRALWNVFAEGNQDVAKIVRSSGNQDAYRYFACRAFQLISSSSRVGLVIAGGFAKNPADAEIRKLVFGNYYGEWLIHFVNTKRLFESLPPVVEFCLFVARTNSQGQEVTHIGFDILGFPARDDAEFRGHLKPYPVLDIRRQVTQFGTLVQSSRLLSTQAAANALGWLLSHGIDMADELNRTTDAALFQQLTWATDTRLPSILPRLIQEGYISAYAGRNFYQYDDLPVEKSGRWVPQSEDAINYTDPRCAEIRKRCRYYRLAIRKTCGSPKTNIRSSIAVILRPGCSAGNSVLLEVSADQRPTSHALTILAVMNSYAFDFYARPHVQANLNQAILRMVPAPNMTEIDSFSVHSALRLTCNHMGYTLLWAEQLGYEWREPGPRYAWPILASDDDRWEVRAAIDAVVAYKYELTKEQYKHALSTFNHRRYPKAPDLCLQRFDELVAIGLEAFTRKYDPYWDVPLVETLPKPVIELPVVVEGDGNRVSEEGTPYVVKDMFGNAVPTNLFGEVVESKKRGRKKR